MSKQLQNQKDSVSVNSFVRFTGHIVHMMMMDIHNKKKHNKTVILD